MAGQQDPDPLKGAPLEITIIDASNPGHRGREREAPAALVQTTGHTRFNRAGTALLDDLAKQRGLPVDGYNVKLGGDEATGFVGIYPVDLTTTGAVGVRRNKRHRFVTVYLHDLFKEMEKLRPEKAHKCQAATGKDAKGRTGLFLCTR